MTDRTDIVVIGAGVAGLVAAASAAVEGRRVSVLDAHPVGGRARSTVQQGFTLNLGAHALYRKGAFARKLARLGITPSGHPPAVDKGCVVRGGELHRLPVGAASLMTTSALKGRSRVAAATMFARSASSQASAAASSARAGLSAGVSAGSGSRTISG